jgi:glutaredoxin
MRPVRASLLVAVAGLATASLLCTAASAQQVYRIVGPNGHVTFSDTPPADSRATLAPVVSVSTATNGAGLPYELRQASSKYPVTLYTSANCNACGSGRAYLASRGIPFTEKTVSSIEDADALRRLAGESVVPLITIGGQLIRGYSDSEWRQYLDAAGYPTKSVLPPNWTNPPPAPLVTAQRALPPAAAAPAAAVRRPSTPPASPLPSADNPAGIKF